MKTLKIFKYIGFGILGAGFLFLVIWGVMALWNCLIPAVFNGPVLTYWQTFGLFLLSKILLTGIAPHSRQDQRSKQEWRSKYHHKFGRCSDDTAAEQAAPEA